MTVADPWCHSASIEVRCDATTALAYLADGIRQGEWALGSIDRRQEGPDLFTGISMFGGGREYIRIRPDPVHGVIWYDVGRAPASLRTLALIRVLPGELLGRPEGTCVVTLLAWRPHGVPDADWQRTAVAHETEMYIIKARLEADA